MKVDFYATLRDVTGTKTVVFDLPECSTVRQLIKAMVDRYPALQKLLLQDDGSLWGHVHVFINGRDARFLDDDLDAQISFSDTVSVFPAVGGG